MAVKRVNKARKAQGKCGNCGKPIEVGDSYVWHQFKFGSKRVRCDSAACYFKPSELTTSDKLSRLYGAQENAEGQLDDWSREDTADLQAIVDEAANEIREVAEEYRESASNMEEHFPGGCPAIDECNEKGDECDGWADELDGVDFEEFDPDSVDIDDDASEEDRQQAIDTARDDWAEEQIDKVRDALGNCPL